MKVYWLCFKCFILIQMIQFKKTTKQLFLNFCKTLLMVLTPLPHRESLLRKKTHSSFLLLYIFLQYYMLQERADKLRNLSNIQIATQQISEFCLFYMYYIIQFSKS